MHYAPIWALTETSCYHLACHSKWQGTPPDSPCPGTQWWWPRQVRPPPLARSGPSRKKEANLQKLLNFQTKPTFSFPSEVHSRTFESIKKHQLWIKPNMISWSQLEDKCTSLTHLTSRICHCFIHSAPNRPQFFVTVVGKFSTRNEWCLMHWKKVLPLMLGRIQFQVFVSHKSLHL